MNVIAAALLVFVVRCSASPVSIDPASSLWVVHPCDAGYGARSAMALALRDVKLDWYKVLGGPPAVVVSAQPGAAALPAGFNGTAFFFGRAAEALGAPADPHPEAHAILVQAVGGGATLVAMVGHAEGGDAGARNMTVRGQVYAAYAFSERVLGVEPLYWWTDTEPVFRGPHVVDVAALRFEAGAPRFERRGFFTNDEDLLGGFGADPLGQSVFSTDTWNRVCEALLRLKGNLLLPGTVAFPDEGVYAVAARRGVAITMQHFTLLGVNTWRWPVGVPYSFDANPEVQAFVWDACVEAYAGREAVWTIGYRGLNDYAFWEDEPAFNTTAARCGLISAAMARQAAIVRGKAGRAGDRCVTYLWAEMLELFLSGELVLPPNTTRVFADEGGSGTFDPRVHDLLGEGDGAYYHVQMESPGRMAQLTEMVPPATFYAQLANFVKRGATSYFMLNLSDLKPAAFLVDTVLRYLWNPDVAMSAASPAAAQDAAISSWCVRFFGEAWAVRASSVVAAYFAVDYIDGTNSTLTPQRYGDEHLSGLIRRLLDGSERPANALAFAAVPLAQLTPLHAEAQQLYDDMRGAGAPGAPFFMSSFLLYVQTHHFGCQAVHATATALAAIQSAPPSAALGPALGALDAALKALGSIAASQRAAEQVKWRGLYATDQLVDFANVACLLRDAKAQLAEQAHVSLDGGGPAREAPALCNQQNGAAWRQGTGPWSAQFEYGATADNYPYLNRPADEKSMAWVVRVLCSESSAASCANTPVGGNFNGTADIVLSTPAPGVAIRYTLDGSEPTATSPLYTAPITLTATTKVAAKPFFSDVNAPVLVTRPVFTRSH